MKGNGVSLTTATAEDKHDDAGEAAEEERVKEAGEKARESAEPGASLWNTL